ncbi:hypothetical protein C1646_743706 [Rhizophagus diaphanus]|nr:hypothetical protein C1646_743706 [Rhizophagus diaphanus] [Rhizophagus sp. MUCL 43196]
MESIKNDKETKFMNENYIPSTLNTLPTEIFIKICEIIPPESLYVLSLVCRKFRNILWSFTSEYTQEIWRKSRLLYYPKITLSPPKFINEQRYIWLRVLSKTCEYCREFERSYFMIDIGIYWNFQVFACENCIYERIISYRELKKRGNFPMEILDCIPAISYRNFSRKYFLTKDIEKAEKEYNSIKTNEDKLQWIFEKHNDLKNMEKEIERHIEKDLEVRFNRQYDWCKKVDM